MSAEHKKSVVPCVLFAYNRPDTFAQVVSALKTQDIDHLIVFIDGPKNNKAARLVEECKKIAKGIDWVGVDYVFKDKNEGLAGIADNIKTVFQSYASAAFLEDDCLPMPGFYSVIKGALRYYERDKRVFSIGGYQQIQDTFFKSYRYSFVSSARFMGWGWATWKDQWDTISPCFSGNCADLKSYSTIPDSAGDDLVSFARDFSVSGKKSWETSPAWDIKVAILTLYFMKVHLLPTKGLIRNIGLNAGFHFVPDQANDIIFNRNVCDKRITEIKWLDDTQTHDEYNKRLKASVDSIRNYFSEKAALRTLKDNPITLGEIIAKVPYVLSLMRKDPLQTINKISQRLTGRPIRTLLHVKGQSKITGYGEYLGNKRDTKYKRALLSYLVEPLLSSPDKRDRTMFSNRGIAQNIPRALNELGYIVDIINFDNKKFAVKTEYNLFIGHLGINFESIYKQLSSEAIKICFSTSPYWQFFNTRERERLEYLNRRRGIILPYDRYIYDSEEFANRNADGILCLGSEFVKQTYSEFPLVVSLNNAAFPDNNYNYNEKDFEEGRKNFLFYGGSGNIHKGLDLLLDVFLETENHLYIYTAIDSLFKKAFYKELTDVPNIHLGGYVHLHDPQAYAVLNRCNFVLYPSCSEGQPGSVIECMHKGLIPIVSRESNIDTGDFGITLDTCSVEEIHRVVQEVSRKPVEWYRERSIRTRYTAQKYYTEERFLANFRDAVEYIIRERKAR
jgi:hypothetical protein